MRVLEPRVVSVVQGNTKTVQVARKSLLRCWFLLAELRAEVAVFLKAQVILFCPGQIVLYGKPGGREGIAQVLQTIRLFPDYLPKVGASDSAPAVGFYEVAYPWVLLLQCAAIEVERFLLDFVQDDDDRRITSEAIDHFQPVF